MSEYVSAETRRRAVVALGLGWFVALAVLLTAATLEGCGASALEVHAGVADVAGQVITASGEQLLEHRARDLRAAVDEAPARDVAAAGVEVVQARYEPAVAAYDALRLTHDAYVGTLVLAAAGDLDDVGRWVRLASRVVAAWAAWSAAGRALGLDVVDPPAMLLVLTSVGGAP